MNTKLIKQWIENHNPKGKEKLAGAIELSVSGLDKILNGGSSHLTTAKKLASVIGVSLDELSKDSTEEEDDSPPAA